MPMPVKSLPLNALSNPSSLAPASFIVFIRDVSTFNSSRPGGNPFCWRRYATMSILVAGPMTSALNDGIVSRTRRYRWYTLGYLWAQRPPRFRMMGCEPREKPRLVVVDGPAGVVDA